MGQNQSPFATYKLATPALNPTRRSFSYPFVMSNATDLNARLAVNMGASSVDVYLDSVSLFLVAKGDFDRDRCIGFDDLKVLTSQWLQQGSGLTGDLNSDSKVDFSDLSVLGDNWPGGGPCP